MSFTSGGVLTVIYFLSVVSAIQFEEGKPCSIDNGYCLDPADCDLFRSHFKYGKETPATCGFVGNRSLVCCTMDKSQMFGQPGVSLASEMCTRYKAMTCPIPWNGYAAVGGVEAEPLELPFMALIGYGSENDIEWRCGGSLISERFVLSAAHCSQTANIGPARWAKLGELNTATEEDDARPEIFEIIERIDHPDYKPNEIYNDITLYKLSRNVVFNDYIKPICLEPSKGLIDTPRIALAAGWGRLGFIGKKSPTLMKVKVDLFDIGRCSGSGDSTQMPNGVDGNSMMCAGSDEGGRDTCPGDSGGPLFEFVDETLYRYPCHQYKQLGITSFGNQCGLAEFPGVYTKVIHYIKWIESIVWARKTSNPLLIWS